MKPFCCVILACCIIAFLGSCTDSTNTLKPGQPAKDFRLDTLTHGRFYLNQHRGKVVVLTFWATWCTTCKQELVDLKTFSDIPGSENLVVVAACSDPENISDLKTITKNLGLNYPVLLDEQAKVSQLYKAPFFPTTFIIDQSQNISFVREGYSPSIAKQLRDKVSSLLASDGSTK